MMKVTVNVLIKTYAARTAVVMDAVSVEIIRIQVCLLLNASSVVLIATELLMLIYMMQINYFCCVSANLKLVKSVTLLKFPIQFLFLKNMKMND